MSLSSFIASDYELPEVFNSKIKTITLKEAINMGLKPGFKYLEELDPDTKIVFVEDEDDFGELVIDKDYYHIDMEEVKWYTQKNFIYNLSFTYTDDRAEQLIKYLRKNIKKGSSIELWRTWLNDKQTIEPVIYDYNEVTVNSIKLVYDAKSRNFNPYSCIIVKK